jgi:hypothetical protein
MKYAIIAAAFAIAAPLGISAQAEPVKGSDALKVEATKGDAVQKIWWHNRWRSHYRWGSGRRWRRHRY